MKKRNVRKWGNSIVIMLTPTDIKDLNIKVGDEIDITKIIVIKKNNNNNNKK